MKRILSLLLVLALAVSLVPAARAYDGPAVSSNINDHFYVNASRWNDPIKSTLAAEDGGYVRVEYIGTTLVVERYDQELNYVSGRELAQELPVYGGVYISDDYNFVVTGQNNPEESDETEVIRITRYSKDWERIDHASLFGANTTVPFDAGTVRFDRSGDMLYIRTCHEMYTSDDGLNHQANVFIALRISDMTVTDELSKVWNLGYGYVSHSFNQFVRVDGDTLLAVDHGDYYPRSVVLIKYGKSAGSETFYGKVSYVNALNIVDSTYHYNDTGVSVGGFECSSDHYLIAGSSYDQLESTDLMDVHRNIFVTATPKDNFTDEATTINWLTSYTADDAVTISPPHMVKLSSDRFALLWTENGALKLCFVNGKGESEGTIYDWEGALSDCVPILDGSRILWYVTNNSAPVFYEVDLTGPAFDSEVLAYGKAGDSIDWVLSTDGHLELTGTGEMYDFTEESQPWLTHAADVCSVTMSDGITSIGSNAFSRCSNLTSVRIPDSVRSLGSSAFAYCKKLSHVTIPEGITSIPNHFFYYCEALTDFVLPNTVTEIGASAFAFCYSLTELALPAGLTSLGNAAFWRCENLRSIVIPDGITALDHSIFYYCIDLQSVTLPAELISIDYWCFEGCKSLTNVVLPDTLESIGANAFQDTASLTSITFPASVKTISAFSFKDSGLTSMTFLGDAPTFTLGMGLEEYAFGGVTATAYYPKYNPTWTEDVLLDYSGDLTWVAVDNHTHNWTAATCTEPSTCTICGATSGEALGHSFGAWVRITEPGCAAEGREERTCAVCGEKESRPVPAVGHDYTSVVTNPTCTEDGFTTHTCSNCGDSYTDGQVPALGHDYVDLVTEPTCTEAGFTTHTCSRCADTYTDSETPALGHDYVDLVTEPTCTEAGFTTHTCSRCADTYTDSETPALGHSWDEGVVITEPTEEEHGLCRYTCTTCGKTEDKVIPALGHEHEYTHTVTAPTCTEPGFTTHTCAGCGHSYTDSETPALGHQEVTDAGSAATCTEPGLTDGAHCGRCGITLREQTVIPASGHSYTASVTAPTCTEPGYTTHTCSRCGDSYTDAPTEAPGHSWKGLDCLRCGETRENPFSDAVPGKFYFVPMMWAVDNNITQGTGSGKFSPDDSCTRGQVVTFLWRAAGAPEPTVTDHPFTDVKEGAYYYKAMLWAVEKGITKGTSATTFGPKDVCNRGTVVTFLWRAKGKPAPESTRNPFSDVADGKFYYNAVLWAVENNITSGISKTAFAPADSCTRGQVVTFLYRAFS